jgi:hypothetical protein
MSSKRELVTAVRTKYGQIVIGPKYVLDGAGPARYGFARVAPAKEVFLGRTIADSLAKVLS